MPKSAPAAHFDEKSVAGLESDMPGGFPSRQSLYRSVLAHDAEAIGHCVFTTVEPPRCATRPLHCGLHARRREHLYFLGHAEAAAEFARPAGVLAQFSVGNENRSFALARFHRRIMGVAVVDAKRRILSVAIVQSAPAAAGKRLWKMKCSPGLRIETESAR